MPSGWKCLIGTVTFAVSIAGPAQGAEKIVWDWAIYGPPRALTKPIEHVAKFLEEKTNGNFTWRLHYAESISPSKSVLDGLQINAFQGALVTFGYGPGKTPLHLAVDLPYLPYRDIDGYVAAVEAFDRSEPIAAEAAQWNSKLLYLAAVTSYEFMGRGKPPLTLEDWKGMRVRALGPGGDAMRVLGAVPTTVPAPEAYSALERGTFDAASLPFTYAFGTYKLHEVSDWYTYGLQFQMTHNSWSVSKSAYEALPEEYRDLLESQREIQYTILKNAYAADDAKWLPIFDKTLKRITITPEMQANFRKRAGQPVWDNWAKEMEGKGLPGRQVLDFLLASIEKATAAN